MFLQIVTVCTQKLSAPSDVELEMRGVVKSLSKKRDQFPYIDIGEISDYETNCE